MNLHYFKLDGVYSVLLFVKCGQIFLELNSKRLFGSSGKEKESRYLVFMSSRRREIRHFHIIVVQWSRQRNVQKSVLHVQIWCFVNLNLLLFWNMFPLPSPLSLLKFPRKSRFKYLCKKYAVHKNVKIQYLLERSSSLGFHLNPIP